MYIADYEIVRTLGQGNHGTFFLAHAPARLGLDTDLVALKSLTRAATDQEFERLSNELELFAAARSPYLVTLYEAGHQSGSLYYVMEYCERGSLAQPSSPLERADVLRAVANAARGAHALHELGVAHRDIKPANILLTADGRGKLSDLGLAQVLTPGLTVTGTGPIGAVEYMDPDVLRGEKASRASDIWSLGTTLHRVLAGVGVYGDIPDGNVVAAIRAVTGSRPAISERIDDGVAEVVRWCLEPDPGDRPPTAADVADRLDEHAEAA